MNMLTASINDIRNILINLSPKSLDEHGYVVAVEELVNRLNKSNLLKFELSIHGLENRLEKKLENALYRITQELINNSLKHAQAKKIILDVLKSENKITLMYEDDGAGCDLEKVKNGYGLTNIKTRAQMFNGVAHFDSSIGNGFGCEVYVSC
jgi:signal transduction histidine kinase